MIAKSGLLIQANEILDSAMMFLSDIKPSEWAEENRILTGDVTPFPGPFRYERTPYLREVADCLSPDHPARVIAVKKGAQIGFSTGVIEAGIGWIISQNPGNILFLTGHSDLAEEAMNGKIDQMIDSSGLRKLIRPNVRKLRNQRTGDTGKSKEFPGGSLVAGSASNHKLLRQRSVKYAFIDDFDAAKKSSKESGNTRRMIEQRLAAYYDKMKLFYISTPELLQTSNIEPVFHLGDQRKYHIPCPCCSEYIPLLWSTPIEGTDGKELGGITWSLDASNKLIPGSVGYICQKCGEFFDDSRKHELMMVGEWRAMAEPSEIGYYSYHISSLYAPPGMYDWEFYVRQYLEANPVGGKPKEDLVKTFTNLVLGEPFEQTGKAPEANAIQKNIRNYPVNSVPEWISEKDGNGEIVMLTCAADMNGTEEDARLDYEVTAWSETGSSYSIRHGSIGTFVPREGAKRFKEDRERWTYYDKRQRSVWPEFEKIINEIYVTDTGRKMKVIITGLDCGHYTTHAYAYIDSTNSNVVGLKGDKEGVYRKFGIDLPVFKPARERAGLYLLDVNYIKDLVSNNIDLTWVPGNGEVQPPGFMNYPSPSDGMYQFKNYFSHYEAEHRIIETKEGEGIASRWVKKRTNDQNHFWDVYIYNYALKEIWAYLVLKEAKKPGTWADFVRLLRSQK